MRTTATTARLWLTQWHRTGTRQEYSSFTRAASEHPTAPRIFVSQSSDPYLNLSVEHYLLQKTPAHATVLFLYTNRPCVVIGRNQNPWLEANLAVLQRPSEVLGRTSTPPPPIDLLRRRSGGGTVFHDEGNVNYCVICPTADFDRDRYAQMVVRALHKLGVARASVNERHDIVLASQDGVEQARKVSGSAYKVTRLRSLHHGTCLLSSPNLARIGYILRSPAKPYLKARGVDSVSSPVANVGVANADFEAAVVEQFRALFPSVEEPFLVAPEAVEEPSIQQGMAELMSTAWIYGQTPQFSFSTGHLDDDMSSSSSLPASPPVGVSYLWIDSWANVNNTSMQLIY